MFDLIIILAFIVYSISAGFRYRKISSKNLNEYFLAGRSLSGWKAGLSMAATQYAADTPLLVTGLIASSGIFALWRLWIYALAFLMMGFLLSTGWRKAKVLTDAELTEIRYSGKAIFAVRIIKALYYGTLVNCSVLAMVLVAAMRISEIFCPWHMWLPSFIYTPFHQIVIRLHLHFSGPGTLLDPTIATTNNLITIFLLTAFTTLYSATGGLRSVVATDIVQFGIAMCSTLIYAIIAVAAVGGLHEMIEKMYELYGVAQASKILSFSPQLSKDAIIPFFVVISLQWFFQMNSDGTGYLAQRSMGCKTDNDARLAAVVFTVAQIFFRTLCWLPICIALLVLYPILPGAQGTDTFIAERELLFVVGAKDLLPPGILGLMLTGLLAALASTLDTHLNWGSSYWSNDIYKELIAKRCFKRSPSGKELVWVARTSNLIILVISLTIMTQIGSIQEAWHITLLFGAGIGAVLVLRWIWERINIYSEIAAMVSAIILAPLLLFSVNDEWIRLAIMALISTFVVVITTLLTPAVNDETLKLFFKKVQPAGFWTKTARKTGIDPRIPINKLIFALAMIGFTSISLFAGLFGFGKLILPIPNEPILWPVVSLGIMVFCGYSGYRLFKKGQNISY